MKKPLFIVSLIWTSFIAYGQKDPLPDPEAYFTAIIVNDMESSINWYSDHFGFKVLNSIESEERGFKQANLKRGQILIELIELESSLTPKKLLTNYPAKTKIDGFFKFGLIVSDFDRWVASLRDSKVEFYGDVVTDTVSGKRMVILKDPDGNRIQLFEY